MALKGSEQFVAEVLIKHFGLSAYHEVKSDPPDIIINMTGQNISVEISDLDENSLQGRRTTDYGFIAFIKQSMKPGYLSS